VPGWPVAEVGDTLGVSGPMGRTVADAALLLAVLSGPDPRVPLALDAPPPALASPADVAALLERDVRGLRVAWTPDLGLTVAAEVRAALAPARQVLADLGCEVIDGAPDLRGADEVFRTLRAFRYGTRFGQVLRENPGQLGPNVTWNTLRGLEVTTADLRRAGELRVALAQRVSEFFAEVDVLACPVSQVAPFDVELDWVHEIDGVPQQTYLDWMAGCYLISVTELPAVSVPAGFTAAGLPVGLQLVGRRRAEWDLLGVARAFESATGCGRIAPGVLG
jgi:amidase